MLFHTAAAADTTFTVECESCLVLGVQLVVSGSQGPQIYYTTALSVWPWLPLVSEQFNFSGVGLLVPCPTPSYPGGQMIFCRGSLS
jgi:hypothetical protein